MERRPLDRGGFRLARIEESGFELHWWVGLLLAKLSVGVGLLNQRRSWRHGASRAVMASWTWPIPASLPTLNHPQLLGRIVLVAFGIIGHGERVVR
jgi:hypothetical protein